MATSIQVPFAAGILDMSERLGLEPEFPVQGSQGGTGQGCEPRALQLHPGTAAGRHGGSLPRGQGSDVSRCATPGVPTLPLITEWQVSRAAVAPAAPAARSFESWIPDGCSRYTAVGPHQLTWQPAHGKGLAFCAFSSGPSLWPEHAEIWTSRFPVFGYTRLCHVQTSQYKPHDIQVIGAPSYVT